MSQQSDTQTLIESFSTLADAVQELIDRKTILEHKLRFAAEQYQQLADQHAVAAPEIGETLANLQLPLDLHKPAVPSTCVPLPKRGQAGCSQHQIALLIRDGRRAAQHLSAHTGTSGGTGGGLSSKETASDTAPTSMFTAMEQDFTVEGKKGVLDCPFSAAKREQHLQRQRLQLEQQLGQGQRQEQQQQQQQQQQQPLQSAQASEAGGEPLDRAAAPAVAPAAGTEHGEETGDPTPHHSTDPICAAMFEEVTSQPAPSSGGAVRCPIRYLDQHSPEEVAHYVETHKHQLPRSHAICLRRYNKNEEQIRKIDAKYGSLVNMISGLGQFHQPMMASGEAGGLSVGPGGGLGGAGDPGALDQGLELEAVDRAVLHHASHERVKTWAEDVSAAGTTTGNGSGSSGRHGSERSHTSNDPGGGLRGAVDGTKQAGARPNAAQPAHDEEGRPSHDSDDDEREGHFDRPFKEVRVGESPSRPWGIAVPISSLPEVDRGPPLSPPAAPVQMPSPMLGTRNPALASPVLSVPPAGATAAAAAGGPSVGRKCPFDHTKFAALGGGAFPSPHGPMPAEAAPAAAPAPPPAHAPTPEAKARAHDPRPGAGRPEPPVQASPLQPAFVSFPPAAGGADPLATPKPGVPAVGGGGGTIGGGGAQMVFTGPVFIGYPMEQALQFMQQFQAMQGR